GNRSAVSPASLTTVNPPIFPTNAEGPTPVAFLSPTIGGAAVDPTAVNILNVKNNYYGGTFLVPRAGQPGCLATSATNLKCVFSRVAPVSDTQYVISYDRPFFSGKSKVSGRWFYDNGNTNAPFATATTLA